MAGPFVVPGADLATLGAVEDETGRRVRDERERVEAEYRRVLKSSVEFEKKIRDRWRQRNREKKRRIAELEERVRELERRLEEDRGDFRAR